MQINHSLSNMPDMIILVKLLKVYDNSTNTKVPKKTRQNKKRPLHVM